MLYNKGKEVKDIILHTSEGNIRIIQGWLKQKNIINPDLVYGNFYIEGASEINVGDGSNYYLVIKNTNKKYLITSITSSDETSIKIENNMVFFEKSGSINLTLIWKGVKIQKTVNVIHINATIS